LKHQSKETLFVRAWAFRNVLLLWLIRPSIIEVNERRAVVRVPLNWITRRRDIHAMYLGVLCMGADISSGLVPFFLVRDQKLNISIIFKDIKAVFLKRAEGDVLFTCAEGDRIQELLRLAESSGERQEATVHVVATVPDKLGAEPVATFELTLSLKKR
jgi:hypothetical protein